MTRSWPVRRDTRDGRTRHAQRKKPRKGPAPLVTWMIAGLIFLIAGGAVVGLKATGDNGSATDLTVPEAALPTGPDPAWPTRLIVTRNEETILRSDSQPWLALGLTDASRATATQPVDSIQIPPTPNPTRLGWYCPGRSALDVTMSQPRNGADCQAPVPGNPGPAVVLGHVNGGGKPGVFAELHKVRKGDTIQIQRSDGRSVWFNVTRATGPNGIPKEQFPTPAVYGPTQGAELRLITCGGRLDRSADRYLDQIIVWATLDHTRTAS